MKRILCSSTIRLMCVQVLSQPVPCIALTRLPMIETNWLKFCLLPQSVYCVGLIAASEIVHERLQDFCSAFQVRWLPRPGSGAGPDRAPARSAGLPRRAGGARVKSALNFLSAAVYGIGHLYSSCLQPGTFHRFIPYQSG